MQLFWLVLGRYWPSGRYFKVISCTSGRCRGTDAARWFNTLQIYVAFKSLWSIQLAHLIRENSRQTANLLVSCFCSRNAAGSQSRSLIKPNASFILVRFNLLSLKLILYDCKLVVRVYKMKDCQVRCLYCGDVLWSDIFEFKWNVFEV